MSQARSAWIARRGGLPAVLCTVLLSSLAARNAAAPTQQPFLLATTQVNGNPAVASFTRNDAGGTLTEVAGSPFTLVTPGCYPSAIDPQGDFSLAPAPAASRFIPSTAPRVSLRKCPIPLCRFHWCHRRRRDCRIHGAFRLRAACDPRDISNRKHRHARLVHHRRREQCLEPALHAIFHERLSQRRAARTLPTPGHSRRRLFRHAHVCLLRSPVGDKLHHVECGINERLHYQFFFYHHNQWKRRHGSHFSSTEPSTSPRRRRYHASDLRFPGLLVLLEGDAGATENRTAYCLERLSGRLSGLDPGRLWRRQQSRFRSAPASNRNPFGHVHDYRDSVRHRQRFKQGVPLGSAEPDPDREIVSWR